VRLDAECVHHVRLKRGDKLGEVLLGFARVHHALEAKHLPDCAAGRVAGRTDEVACVFGFLVVLRRGREPRDAMSVLLQDPPGLKEEGLPAASNVEERVRQENPHARFLGMSSESRSRSTGLVSCPPEP
jgi:hypothetical protein